MNQQIFNILKNISTDTKLINKLIISLFVDINKLNVKKNVLIKTNYITLSNNIEYKLYSKFLKTYKSFYNSFNFENLIELFEFVISPKDKVVNGAVYTPLYIRNKIISDCISNFNKFYTLTFCDMSCGCGGFLYSVAKALRKKTGLKYKTIFEKNIYGLDITKYSVERSKIVLTLLALSVGEDVRNIEFNIYKGNALEYDWFKNHKEININEGFDVVVGNPPYVSSKNISLRSKKLLTKWSVCRTGLTDLYIPFFQIGLTFLKKNGILGYITMNTFLKSLNGRALRSLFTKKQYHIKIIDFRGEQIFKNKNTYTCLCFIVNRVSNAIFYTKKNKKSIIKSSAIKFNKIKYESLDDFHGWSLGTKNIVFKIKQIENIWKKIGDIYNIRNGFATLLNDLFIFKPIHSNGKYFLREYDNQKFLIEKAICKNAIKPNILRSETDLKNFKEKIIFPYKIIDNKVKAYSEKDLKEKYPKAYLFLYKYKKLLATRDKSKGEYEKWYAFGRSQSLIQNSCKLLFPYISDKPCFIFSAEKNLLFYNGYAVISENKNELLILKKVLESKIFWFYISNTSKPYSNNYYALAKNYIKNFGIPNFSVEEKAFLLETNNKDNIDSFLLKKYNLKQL